MYLIYSNAVPTYLLFFPIQSCLKFFHAIYYMYKKFSTISWKDLLVYIQCFLKTALTLILDFLSINVCCYYTCFYIRYYFNKCHIKIVIYFT